MPQQTTIKIAFNPAIQAYLPLQYAMDKGYFEKANIKLEVTIHRASAVQLIPQLARGDLDIAPTSPAPALFNQVVEGFDLQVIGAGALERQGRMATTWLTVDAAKANEIREFRDLRGRPVEAALSGSPLQLMTLIGMREAGLDPAKDATITYRVRQTPDMLALARAKGADVIGMIEPLALQAEREGLVKRWKSLADVVPWYQPALFGASKRFADSNQPAIEKFLEIYVLTARELNGANGEWTPDILATATKWAEAPANVITDQGKVPYFEPNGIASVESLERTQNLWLETGDVKTKVDLSRMVNTRPLEAVLSRIGRVQS